MKINKKVMIVCLAFMLMLAGCDLEKESALETSASTGTEAVQTTPSPSDNGEETAENTEENTTVSEEPEAELPKPSAAETKPANWYIRLTAEDPVRGMRSVGTRLGEVEENDAVRNHTLKAISPFGRSYLDIVFVDPDGVGEGEYKTNFHTYREGQEDRWRFTVKTDDNSSDIILRWRGIYVLTPYVDEHNRKRYREYRSMTNPLTRYMKLVDTQSGQEIAAVSDGEAQIYRFNMNGAGERDFEWVVQTEEVSAPAGSGTAASRNLKSVRMYREKRREYKEDTFDLSRPPMIKGEQ